MNQKKAKSLRSIARSIAAKNPEAIQLQTVYDENKSNRKIHTSYKTDKEGNFIINEQGRLEVEQSTVIASGTMTISGQCVRGIYRNLKKNAK